MLYDKKQAIKIVTSGAKKYEKNFANKKLLFLCVDKHNKVSYLEVLFQKANYLHLTGLKLVTESDYTRLNNIAIIQSATDFYNHCLSGNLSEHQFDFSEDGTTQPKLDIISKIFDNPNLSAKMVGDYNTYFPKLYTEKVVGNIEACMGFVNSGLKDNLKYSPNTLLKRDIRDCTTSFTRIIATFRKERKKEKYDEIIYKAKVNWKEIKLPNELLYLKKML